MFAGQVSGEVSRLYVGLLAVTGFLCLVGMRYFLKKTVGRSALLRIPVLIVGAGLTADAVVREFKKDSGLNYTVIGFLEDHEPKTDYVKEYPILGGFANLEKVVAETGVRNVLIAAPGLPRSSWPISSTVPSLSAPMWASCRISWKCPCLMWRWSPTMTRKS